MKISIGILTFHKAYNYGAFLQCYSLQQLLQKRFSECRIDVIDYLSPKMRDYYSKNVFIRTWASVDEMEKHKWVVFAKVFINSCLDNILYRRRSVFEKRKNLSISIGQQYLTLSPKHICEIGGNSFLNAVTDYDIIIVGSDAVWNDKQMEHPNIYYLGNVGSCVKMSYAASSYGMNFLNLEESRRKNTAQALSYFDYIGVRDQATEEYVLKMLPDANPHHNCDPSVFLDMDKIPVKPEEVKKKIEAHGIDFSRPTICFMCADWLAKRVREKLGNKYQYVAVYQWNNVSDYYLDDLNPFEWAVVFRYFSATFTHYFHGTLFSLKNHTLVYSVEKASDYSRNYNTKIEDVLRRLSLSNRHFCFEEMVDDTWAGIDNEICKGPSAKYIADIDAGLAAEANTKEDFLRSLNDAITKQQ